MSLQFSERLISARKMAGISLQDLSDRLDIDITKQALNKYEHGTARPSGETLVKIASVLKVPVDYFYRDQKVKLGPVEFRKYAHLKVSEIERIKAECSDYLERYIELEDLLNNKKPFEDPFKGKKPVIKSEDDIEKAAERFRDAWQLGRDPIAGVLPLLEDHGVRIYEIEAHDAFSGMSTVVDDIPIIVLNKIVSVQRRRFTALHELAHLIFEFAVDDEKVIENLCHTFAGAVLLPNERFTEWFGERRSSISLQELEMIDENYGISVQAIVARAYFLGLISDQTYRDFNIWLSKNGKRKKEFVERICFNEKLSRFDRLLYKAVTEGIISESKGASLANRKLADFREEIIAIS
jgi:Zn-dependent peptidase ImmA (M78 family)/DNA-binding XRE family transcriptional regulator